MSEFEKPADIASGLELPFLGAMSILPDVPGPVVVAPPKVERVRREVHEISRVVLGSNAIRSGAIGVLGDISPTRRAWVSSTLAATLATEGPTTLIDSDLKAAALTSDNAARPQEGLVDVMRYGVSPPRVIAATQAAGLRLLPVGAGTVDYTGTYGSEAASRMFEEFFRSGELVVVNGPNPEDFLLARPFLEHVAAWVLVHELGRSDPARTEALRDDLGAARCLGLLVLGAEQAPMHHAPQITPQQEVVIASDAAPLPAEPTKQDRGQEAFDHQPTDDSLWLEPPRRPKWVWGVPAALVLLLAAAGLWWSSRDKSQPELLSTPPSGKEAAAATRNPDPATQTHKSEEAPGGQGADPQPSAELAQAESNRTPDKKTTQANEAVAQTVPLGTHGRLYGIHVSSVKSEAGARQEARRFEDKGFPVVTRLVEIPARGLWHRVYIGPYGERSVAESIAQELTASGVLDYAQVHSLPKDAKPKSDNGSSRAPVATSSESATLAKQEAPTQPKGRENAATGERQNPGDHREESIQSTPETAAAGLRTSPTSSSPAPAQSTPGPDPLISSRTSKKPEPGASQQSPTREAAAQPPPESAPTPTRAEGPEPATSTTPTQQVLPANDEPAAVINQASIPPGAVFEVHPYPARRRTIFFARFPDERSGDAQVAIKDADGNVRIVLEGLLRHGSLMLVWDGKGRDGATLPVGEYSALLTATDATLSTTLVVD